MTTQYAPSQTLFTIHPLLLAENQLLWDVREEITQAGHLRQPEFYLSPVQLQAHATTPLMPKLEIQCGIFPDEYGWDITTSNPMGVTIRDVLEAIHGALKRQITHAEWDQLSAKQRDRVRTVFDKRWRTADTPMAARAHGVLRQDCLLLHTIFKGLSPSYEGATDCILTLGRLPASHPPE